MKKIRFNLYPNAKQMALTISSDDGMATDKKLAEILDRYGMKGTFCVSSPFLGTPGYLTAEDVKQLSRNHEIAVHTVNHQAMTCIPKQMIASEVMEDRRRLEEIIERPVRGMGLPQGFYNAEMIEQIKGLGIEYMRTIGATQTFALPEDVMCWRPSFTYAGDLEDAFHRLLKSVGNYSMLWNFMRHLYISGHSYELDNNNGWSKIEEFCKLAGGRADIWYAPAIEIYDYLAAIWNLKTTVSGDIMYNPSLCSVWFTLDGEPMEIKSGETLKLF